MGFGGEELGAGEAAAEAAAVGGGEVDGLPLACEADDAAAALLDAAAAGRAGGVMNDAALDDPLARTDAGGGDGDGDGRIAELGGEACGERAGGRLAAEAGPLSAWIAKYVCTACSTDQPHELSIEMDT